MKQSDLMHIAMHQQLLEQAEECTRKIALAVERGRCLRIIEKQCVEMASDESKKMDQARREGRQEAEMFYSHGSWVASELNDRIYKEIIGASMEDPIGDETDRCIAIVKEIAGPHISQNEMADIERRIRGEG